VEIVLGITVLDFVEATSTAWDVVMRDDTEDPALVAGTAPAVTPRAGTELVILVDDAVTAPAVTPRAGTELVILVDDAVTAPAVTPRIGVLFLLLFESTAEGPVIGLDMIYIFITIVQILFVLFFLKFKAFRYIHPS
jgi:hypothetical protein